LILNWFNYSQLFSNLIISPHQALELQPNNTKSLFRRGQARHHLGALDQAAEDIEKAISLDPNDAMCRAELQAIKAKQKAADKKHANAFAGMFDRMSSS
jgi:predicted TPR repeat methyltransferase